MNFPCPTNSNCSGTDSPFANLSAEAPDQEVFFGLNLGFPWLQPPIGSNWASNSCLGECVSTVSQADADLCAVRNDLACLLETWGPPGTIDNGGPSSGPPLIRPPATPLPFYTNSIQACTVLCPDGSPFTYQVAAGLFASASQIMADRMAYTYACNLAQTNLICLASITSKGCVGTPFAATIMPSRNASYVFSIVSGSLPPGLTLSAGPSRSSVIAGVPSAAGSYTFTVRVSTSAGNFMQKTYTIGILGVSTSTLPDADVGASYSQTLTATGGTAPYTFLVELGTLPAGLTLASDGTISGTPTTAGNNSFTVSVTDSGSNFCTKSLSLTVQNAMTCPVFDVEFAGPGQDVYGALDATLGRLLTGSPANLFDTNSLALVSAIVGGNPSWNVEWISTNKEFAFGDGAGGVHIVNGTTGVLSTVGGNKECDLTCGYSPDDDALWCIGWDFAGTGDAYLNKFNCATHAFVSSVDLGPLVRRSLASAYCPVPKVLLTTGITLTHSLDILSLPSGAVLHSINLSPTGNGDFNNGMIYNPVTKTFFASIVGDTAANPSKVIEVDPTLGIVLNTYDLGENNPGGTNIRITQNPSSGEIYVMGKSKFTAIDPVNKVIICQIAMPAGSYAAAFDKASSSVFVGNFSTFKIRKYH